VCEIARLGRASLSLVPGPKGEGRSGGGRGEEVGRGKVCLRVWTEFGLESEGI
jgi:hypothetical protein